MAGSATDPRLEGILPAERHDKDGRRFLVRAFVPADRDALLDFYDQFQPKRAAQGLPPQGRDRVERWLDSVLNEGIHLIAEAGDTLVGHGLLMPTGRPDVCEWAIFLAVEHRGRGMGTEMNRLSIAVARAAGWRKLWLSVEPHNRPAVRSYEKVGYRFLSSAIFSPEAEMELDL